MPALILRQYFALGVVIIVRQVLIKIRRGSRSMLLWDGAEHGKKLIGFVVQNCSQMGTTWQARMC